MNRTLLVIIALALSTVTAKAQHVAATFQDAEKKGYSMQNLDKMYPSALSSDSTKAVFKGAEQTSFINAYKGMLFDLAAYLNKNGFSWGKPTRIFNRIYFKPNGAIDYYLVNLVGTGIDDAKGAQFVKLLGDFTQFYKIKITGETRFAQCSPVLYQDSK